MKILQVYLSDKRLCSDIGTKIEFYEFVGIAKSPLLLKYAFRYGKVQLYCKEFNDLPAPFLALCVCKLMSHGKCEWINAQNEVRKVGICRLIGMSFQFVKDIVTYKNCIQEISQEVDNLILTSKGKRNVNLNAIPLYLRLDLTFGLVAGGSVGHIAGVVNNLKKYCKKPIFVSTDKVPMIDDEIEKYIIKDKIPYRNINGISAYVGNLVSYPVIEEVIKNNEIGFIYQRSGLDIYAGVKAAVEFNLPYVLEYNGSEIWCEEHWGSNELRFVDLARKIEKLTFDKADLITCVSSPLKDQLVEQGISPEKIIVNPNGVDPDKYRPDIDGSKIRRKYEIEDNKVVIGFIGTFGAWHGTELLALAFGRLADKSSDVHLLMIGDGIKMPEVKKNLENIDKSKYSLAGLVPQEEGSEYLAACDILVNPTIPNADGSPFFGSPTKLFEYMAMGKAIVASNMDQMAEVLSHNETALLVEPGNIDAIAGALSELVSDQVLRRKLGANARKEVCQKYTWEIHTKKIIDKLEQLMNK